MLCTFLALTSLGLAITALIIALVKNKHSSKSESEINMKNIPNNQDYVKTTMNDLQCTKNIGPTMECIDTLIDYENNGYYNECDTLFPSPYGETQSVAYCCGDKNNDGLTQPERAKLDGVLKGIPFKNCLRQ